MYALAEGLCCAYRQLRRTPWFTLLLVFTLSLGIGSSTAIFSLVEGILLRPLPFNHPDRLALLGDHLGNSPKIPVTAREIGTYASATEAFSDMGGYIDASYEVSGGEIPERVNGARFTAGAFSTLGVSPILGRTFTQKEEDGHEPVAVISYGLWLNRYHRDPHVVGNSITLNRQTYSIIGVMPRGFDFPPAAGYLDQAQLWVPMSLTDDELSDDHAGFWGYDIIARLKDGVTISQAARDADRVAQQIMRNLPVAQSRIHIRGDVTAERDAALVMLEQIRGTKQVTVGGDKAYDTADFVAECRNLKVTPHVAQNLERPGGSAIDARTTQHPGYAISQRKRKRIEECFGWLKTIALLRKVRHRGIFKVGWVFTFAAAAYNLVRMRNLAMQAT
jgi:hypothetical protein